jgi:hypothetical protein
VNCFRNLKVSLEEREGKLIPKALDERSTISIDGDRGAGRSRWQAHQIEHLTVCTKALERTEDEKGFDSLYSLGFGGRYEDLK